MSATATINEDTDGVAIQLVTFMVGNVSLGIDITFVQEINRHLDLTKVPEASPKIHGVVNLRGEVLTVLDAHKIFGVNPKAAPEQHRNLVLNVDGERIGVLVDQISDILTVQPGELTKRPSNCRSIDQQFVDSVYLRDNEIVVLVNARNLVDVIDP